MNLSDLYLKTTALAEKVFAPFGSLVLLVLRLVWGWQFFTTGFGKLLLSRSEALSGVGAQAREWRITPIGPRSARTRWAPIRPTKRHLLCPPRFHAVMSSPDWLRSAASGGGAAGSPAHLIRHERRDLRQSPARGRCAGGQSPAGGADLSIGEIFIRRCDRDFALFARRARRILLLALGESDPEAAGACSGKAAGQG